MLLSEIQTHKNRQNHSRDSGAGLLYERLSASSSRCWSVFAAADLHRYSDIRYKNGELPYAAGLEWERGV
jgi:hypothetical protein